jgi:hypothetical protein
MTERRGPWYLLTGLIIGLISGLVYAWLLDPVQFVNTSPDSLRPEFKADHRVLIALSYEADGNIVRANQRLALLGDKDPLAALIAQVEQLQKQKGYERETAALARLVADLQAYQSSIPTVVSVAETPLERNTQAVMLSPTATLAQEQMISTPTPTPPQPRPTSTLRPTFTPRPILSAPFILRERQFICDPKLPENLLQILVLDSNNRPVSGIKISITFDQGEEFFYTGLYPEISPGYADYVMQPGIVYSLRVGEGGETASGLTPQKCTTETTEEMKKTTATPSAERWGGWKLVFTQK